MVLQRKFFLALWNNSVIDYRDMYLFLMISYCDPIPMMLFYVMTFVRQRVHHIGLLSDIDRWQSIACFILNGDIFCTRNKAWWLLHMQTQIKYFICQFSLALFSKCISAHLHVLALHSIEYWLSYGVFFFLFSFFSWFFFLFLKCTYSGIKSVTPS